MPADVASLKKHIRDVADFPKTGIVFKDMTPLLLDPWAFGHVVDIWVERYSSQNVTKVVGIESRGFIFGAPLALALGCGFAPMRKPGKLPSKKLSESYALEYGQDTLELHEDALTAHDRVVIVDDLLATGGTLAAAARLVGRLSATILEAAVVVELGFLPGRKTVAPLGVHALITY